MRKKAQKCLELLKKVYQLEEVRRDAEFSNLIITAISKIENGEDLSIVSVRLSPFLTKYVLNNPSKELVDLQIFLQKESTKYRGFVAFSSIFDMFR